jgi:hypothetical protein
VEKGRVEKGWLLIQMLVVGAEKSMLRAISQNHWLRPWIQTET